MDGYNINLDEYSNIISIDNGILTVNDNSIPHDIVSVDETNDLYLVHATDFFPSNKMILSNSAGRKGIPFQYQVDDDIFVVKESVSPRETVHFCLNGKVENTSLGEGKWENPKFIIIEPYVGHEKEFVSGKMHGGDNFTNNSVTLSDKAILVVRDDVLNTLTDEQKNMYNIVSYKGNSNQCIDNLFTIMGIPKINNYADDKTHFYSEQYRQEYVLEKRAQAVKLIKDMDISHTINNYGFTAEDIAMIFKLGASFSDLNQDSIDKLKQALNLDSDYLAEFIISNGIVKTTYGGGYRLLPTKELLEHLDDPDYYIDAVRRSGTGLSELKDKIQNLNIEQYQNSSMLELNHQFDNITVGQLQYLQNFSSLKHLKDLLNIPKDKVLILREDGLYLSDRSEEDVLGNGEIILPKYKNRNATEQLLGYNGDTLKNVQNNYKIVKEINDTMSSIGQQVDAMIKEMENGTLDVNGLPIIDDQTQQTSRQMGFVKVWILGIIAVIASIGIVILGMMFNYQ